MFETHSVRPQRSTTYFLSAALHTVIGSFLVVGPLWAVQDPVDPVERFHPFQVTVTLPKSDEPARIPEHAVVRPGRTQALGGSARSLKHVEMPASIPELSPLAVPSCSHRYESRGGVSHGQDLVPPQLTADRQAGARSSVRRSCGSPPPCRSGKTSASSS